MPETSGASQTIVIDANLAVWNVLPLLADHDVTERFRRWRAEGRRLIAPALWSAECVSAIRRCLFGRLISIEQGRRAIEDLFALEIETIPTDVELSRLAFEWAGRLGQAQAYDAFYLALAAQLAAELWTADRRLVEAARQAGVTWIRWSRES